jgi:hypothetical protein
MSPKFGEEPTMMKTMSEESKPVAEGTPKKTMLMVWYCAIMVCCMVISITALLLTLNNTFYLLHPWDKFPIEGTAVVLNENGEAIRLPIGSIALQYFSHYAASATRPDTRRDGRLFVDESGEEYGKVGKFIGTLPKSAATLFFSTEDEQYAAVVDISPDKATGLVIELRPRYTVTGRLVSQGGTPLADQKLTLECSRHSEYSKTLIRPASGTVRTFHSEEAVTDSEGFFTVANIIPGVNYHLSVSLPPESAYASYRATSVDMPILQPEQYEEPFSLGDVSIPPFSR